MADASSVVQEVVDFPYLQLVEVLLSVLNTCTISENDRKFIRTAFQEVNLRKVFEEANLPDANIQLLSQQMRFSAEQVLMSLAVITLDRKAVSVLLQRPNCWPSLKPAINLCFALSCGEFLLIPRAERNEQCALLSALYLKLHDAYDAYLRQASESVTAV